MSLYELYRHDVQVYTDYSSTDTRQKPATSVSVYVYKEGATTNGTDTIASGAGGTITVRDTGAIAVGDDIQIGTDSSAVRTVNALTATTITVDAAANTFAWDDGDRLIVNTNLPTLYGNDQGAGTALANPVTTDSTGATYFYTKEPTVDLILDDGTTQTALPDRTGVGGRTSYTPFTFGAPVDGTNDDATAMGHLETYVDNKGAGVIDLPPGTIKLGSTWTVTASNLVIRGAGRGATTIEIAHNGIGILLSGTDVVFEGATIKRTTASAGTEAMLEVNGTRVTLKELHFQNGQYGLECSGDTDTRASNLWFTNDGTTTWATFILTANSTRPHFTSIVGRYDNNITAGIDVDYDTKSPRFTNVDVAPADATAADEGGIAFRCRKSGGTNPPRDVIVTASRLCGGKTTGTGPAVQLSTLVGTVGVEGAEFIGVHCVDSNIGYDVNNAKSLKIIGGSTVGINLDGIDIDGGSYIEIVEHLSSDINVSAAANTYSHVAIAAGVDDVYINGLVVGKIIRGTGNDANYAVAIAAGASDRIQIMGVRGVIADLAGWISNASTSQEIDIGHNIEYGGNRSYAHTSVPGGEGVGGLAGTLTLVGTETTADILNVNTLILNQTGDTAWDFSAGGGTNLLTNGRDGQIVTIVNIAAHTATFTEDATYLQLSASPLGLTQYDSLALVWSSTAGMWVQVNKDAV